MSHIVKWDKKTGKYVAESSGNSLLKTSSYSLYDAVDELEKIEASIERE